MVLRLGAPVTVLIHKIIIIDSASARGLHSLHHNDFHQDLEKLHYYMECLGRNVKGYFTTVFSVVILNNSILI